MDWILGNSPDILTLNGGLNIREQEHQDQTKRVSFGTVYSDKARVNKYAQHMYNLRKWLMI